MTKEEYIEELQNAVKTINSLVDKVNEASKEISNLDYSIYVGNASSFKARCIDNIKIYSKMSTEEFSRLNSERLAKELATRIKSLTLACDAMISEEAKSYWYDKKRSFDYDKSKEL